MARKRMIDPGIWQSEDVGTLQRDARLLFIGLFSNADDEGRMKASPAFLKATIFPYDSDINNEYVEQLRDIVAQQKLVILYPGSNGTQLLYIPKWKIYQRIDRPQPSKLPAPPIIDDDSPNAQRTFDPSIGEGRGVKDSIDKSSRIEEPPKAPLRGGQNRRLRYTIKNIDTDEEIEVRAHDIKDAVAQSPWDKSRTVGFQRPRG